MKRDLARDLYRSYLKNSPTRKIKNSPKASVHTSEDETLMNLVDVVSFKDSIQELIVTRAWNNGLAEGSLFNDWPTIIGIEIAAHCQPLSFSEGHLTIQADSTAWATQVRLMTEEITAKILTALPELSISELTILGPHSPSWKHGKRSIRGARGPRDTYG